MTAMLAAFLTVQTLIEYLIYLGAIVGVALIVMFWAVAIRSPGKTRRRKRRHRSRSESEADADDEPVARSERRRRRREARMNPTRAEVGGLPPVRGAEPPHPGDDFRS